MRGRRILILGGTREARELAERLVMEGAFPTTSLAGATKAPARPQGDLRIGGFGGVRGLTDYLASGGFEALVDAAHPFAAQISAHAAEAASLTGVPIIRLERPPWEPQPRDKWHMFADHLSAANAVLTGDRLFLTVGRKELAPFFEREDVTGIVRTIEALDPVPRGWALVRSRPPFEVAAECALMKGHGVDVLVTKNSGGNDTRAKLDAARELGVRVIMINRPRKPNVETASTAEAILARLSALLCA
ncbi:MAG: cobalt-precorrin-6A reductase [Hyphomicrobiales bacterium]